jgi:mannan polymerase II complex MNN10 subunit
MITNAVSSFELNAGSFLTRGTPRTDEFMNAVIDYHTAEASEEHQLSEQDCMRDIMFVKNRFQESYVFVPQYKLNAFPPEIGCYDKYNQKWQHGTFMVHVSSVLGSLLLAT